MAVFYLIYLLLYPLHHLLNQEHNWCFSDGYVAAFEKNQSLLTQSKILVPYNPKLQMQIASDASPFGIGCVMSLVMLGGSVSLEAYASRSLT